MAHAIYPWVPDLDDGPYWAPEYDSRATLMQQGATAAEAVLKLFDDSRIGSKDGLGVSLAALTAEIVLLTRAISRGA